MERDVQGVVTSAKRRTQHPRFLQGSPAIHPWWGFLLNEITLGAYTKESAVTPEPADVIAGFHSLSDVLVTLVTKAIAAVDGVKLELKVLTTEVASANPKPPPSDLGHAIYCPLATTPYASERID